MTVGVDYRNFPRGCIPDMVEDVGRGVRWASRPSKGSLRLDVENHRSHET